MSVTSATYRSPRRMVRKPMMIAHRRGDEPAGHDRRQHRPAVQRRELRGGERADARERDLAEPDHAALARDQRVREEDHRERDALRDQTRPRSCRAGAGARGPRRRRPPSRRSARRGRCPGSEAARRRYGRSRRRHHRAPWFVPRGRAAAVRQDRAVERAPDPFGLTRRVRVDAWKTRNTRMNANGMLGITAAVSELPGGHVALD